MAISFIKNIFKNDKCKKVVGFTLSTILLIKKASFLEIFSILFKGFLFT